MDMKMEKKMKNFIVNHAFVVKSLLAGGNGKAQLPRRHFVREEFCALWVKRYERRLARHGFYNIGVSTESCTQGSLRVINFTSDQAGLIFTK